MLINFRAAIVAAFVAAAGAVGGQLGPGDVAIVAVNTDDDRFAWVALRDIPAGTLLHFTDSSVSNGLFRWSEHLGDLLARGPLTWTSPESLPAGTVVRWDKPDHIWSIGQTTGAALTLSTSGDQVIVYAGNIVSNGTFTAPWFGDPVGARMLTAVNIANKGWDNLKGGTTGTSFVPPGLSTNNGTAAHLGSLDNAYYSGPQRGTADQLRTWMADPAQWSTSDDAFAMANWPSAFDVLPPPPAGTVITLW